MRFAFVCVALAGVLLGCGGASPVVDAVDSGQASSAENGQGSVTTPFAGDGGAAPDATPADAASNSSDACAYAPATLPEADDCFAVWGCTECSLGGVEYWCPSGYRPKGLAGCLTDPLGFTGYTASCCPPACTRRPSHDADCSSGGSIGTPAPGGSAFSCPADSSYFNLGASGTSPFVMPPGTCTVWATDSTPAEHDAIVCCH